MGVGCWLCNWGLNTRTSALEAKPCLIVLPLPFRSVSLCMAEALALWSSPMLCNPGARIMWMNKLLKWLLTYWYRSQRGTSGNLHWTWGYLSCRDNFTEWNWSVVNLQCCVSLGIQPSDSVLYVYNFFLILFHYELSQDIGIEYSSLCYTQGCTL